MRAALGTVEVDDETLKKIGKAVKGSSYMKRNEFRDWALSVIEREIEAIKNPTPVEPGVAPATAPPDADSLPEPAPPTVV